MDRSPPLLAKSSWKPSPTGSSTSRMCTVGRITILSLIDSPRPHEEGGCPGYLLNLKAKLKDFGSLLKLGRFG